MASLYPHHIPTSWLQRFLLGVSSTAVAFANPCRDDMVAVSGETTACYALKHMKQKMEVNETGRRILKEQPLMSNSSIDLKLLAGLPRNTFGRQYVDMLKKYKITPDSRKPVKFVDDPILAYIMQRYREVHDFNHLLLDQPLTLKGGVAVKWYEAIQTTLPICWMSALQGTAKMACSQNQDILQNELVWWIWYAKQSKFFMNMYFEEHLHQDIDELREDMNIFLPRH